MWVRHAVRAMSKSTLNAHPTLVDQLSAKFTPRDNLSKPINPDHWKADWSAQEIKDVAKRNVCLTWSASGMASSLPLIERGEGVYLYTREGKRYLNWTSDVVCVNLGFTVPLSVKKAITDQLDQLPYLYGGLGMCAIRARLSALMAELCPGNITGFLFPSSGGEANEAAIRIARKYTGKQKVMTHYRSYHGGNSTTLGATGDFRRWMHGADTAVNGLVKAFNPTPFFFKWGNNEEEVVSNSLAALEEQIVLEGPSTIAAIMMESVVGAGGVLIHPVGYVQGVRALCDKYQILLILDEVMVGFGRTGKFWGLQHYPGVVPDIMTSAKGLTGAYLPLSMVGISEPIKKHFETTPIGWGSTYQAHPVAMACAYECVKVMLKENVVDHVAKLDPVMKSQLQLLKDKHPSVKQVRAIGLFGCLDLMNPKTGTLLQQLHEAPSGAGLVFKKALDTEGLYGMVRLPFLHCAPPLIISEAELLEGFQGVDRALSALDKAQQ
jgi:adenosylmethionine-8-amino-7-oxononanoate aminotransferase